MQVSKERKSKQSQTWWNGPRFEPLLYVPAFNTMKDFHYDRSRLMVNHYKFLLELNTLTSPLSWCRNTNTELTSLLEATNFTIKKIGDLHLLTKSPQVLSYNQDEEVKLFGIV